MTQGASLLSWLGRISYPELARCDRVSKRSLDVDPQRAFMFVQHAPDGAEDRRLLVKGRKDDARRIRRHPGHGFGNRRPQEFSGPGYTAGNHDHLRIEQRSEEHTSELQSRENLVCRLLLEKKKPAVQK